MKKQTKDNEKIIKILKMIKTIKIPNSKNKFKNN